MTLAALAIIFSGFFGVRWLNGPRLVAWDQLVPDDAEDCATPSSAEQLPNWSGNIPLRVALMQQRTAADSNPADDMAGRKPLRMIRDPNAAYSAVAVDTSHNEVVLTDENLFNVFVYDRQTNTRPTSVSDPKRIIGGLNTNIEFQCGLYIDPDNGDIYAVNNARSILWSSSPDRQSETWRRTASFTFLTGPSASPSMKAPKNFFQRPA